MLSPLTFQPIYKDYIWGGERIAKTFQRKDFRGKVAESWEISDRQGDCSIVAEGPLQGMSLSDLIEKYPKELFGKKNFKRFPLLLKILDAHENLSIQVHPSDEMAKKWGGEAKTEAWYIIDAEEGACIYAGFRKPLTMEEFLQLAKNGEIAGAIQKIPVQKGDVIFIPGGRIHAVGHGCLIYEMQQNSDTTYRIDDWGRKRELHLEKASQVINLRDTKNPKQAPQVCQMEPDINCIHYLSTDHFHLDKIRTHRTIEWTSRSESCEILFFLEGEHQGTTVLIPHLSEPLKLEKPASFLRIY